MMMSRERCLLKDPAPFRSIQSESKRIDWPKQVSNSPPSEKEVKKRGRSVSVTVTGVSRLPHSLKGLSDATARFLVLFCRDLYLGTGTHT